MASSATLQYQPKQKQQGSSSWFSMLKQTASEWSDANAMTWAAALSCYTVLALAPLLVIAIKVATVLLGGQAAAAQKVQEQASSWMGSEAGNAISAIVDKMLHQGGGTVATIISSILVIVSVGGVFSELQQALNRIWKVQPKPGQAFAAFIRARLKSVLVVGLAALLLLASVFVAGFIEHITKSMGMGWRVVTFTVDVLVSFGVLTLIFAMAYKTVPDADIEWRSTWVGALISALLFQIGKYGLALYFKYAAPASAFGAAGSLAAVLIWIYYSSMIVFFGAQFTYVYAMRRGHGVRASKHARPLSECDETETATPSTEGPGNKPARPQPAHGRSPARSGNGGYGAVLAPHASPYLPPRASAQPAAATVPPTILAAGAGLALGALVGGYGALKIKEEEQPPVRKLPPKVQAAVRLRRRVENLEQKITHASRVKQFIERDDLADRLDQIEEKIRATRHTIKHGRPAPLGRTYVWANRLKNAVKHFT